MPGIDATFHSMMKPVPHLKNHIPDEQAAHNVLSLPPPSLGKPEYPEMTTQNLLQPSFQKPRVRGVTVHAYRSIHVGGVSQKALLAQGNKIFKNHVYPTARGHIAPKISISYARQSVSLSRLVKVLF